MKYDLDFSKEDMGEIISIVRVQHYRQTVEGFANRLGFSPKIIEISEEGKGAHVTKVFFKMMELGMIKNVTLSLEI